MRYTYFKKIQVRNLLLLSTPRTTLKLQKEHSLLCEIKIYRIFLTSCLPGTEPEFQLDPDLEH
jgi:hypothetical protein